MKAGPIAARGMTFSTLEAGEGPLVLCLHGFPDSLRSFRHQLPALAAAGYRWSASAENLASGQHTPQSITDSWMASAGHRANMLSVAYTELGTGYAVDANGQPYFVVGNTLTDVIVGPDGSL